MKLTLTEYYEKGDVLAFAFGLGAPYRPFEVVDVQISTREAGWLIECRPIKVAEVRKRGIRAKYNFDMPDPNRDADRKFLRSCNVEPWF